MNENDFIVKYKSILLDTFRFLIEFIESNNLNYFTCAGTTLGAIRHQGIIPWDDDIDIFMPRDDYNWLIQHRELLEGTGYNMVVPGDGDYYLPFLKICNSRTTIWENPLFPFVFGVFVDIFPLDNLNWTREKILKEKKREVRMFEQYQYCIADSSSAQLLLLFKEKHLKTFGKCLLGKVMSSLGNRRRYLDRFIEMQKQLPHGINGKHCIFMNSEIDEVYLSEWFKEYSLMPFDGLLVRVQNGYDNYLKLVYGDYMKLPPLEKRILCHSRYYVNLNEGLTLEEVKERIKKGEYQKY